VIQVRLEPRADTPAWLGIALALLAILAALAICSTLIMLAGANVVDAYRALFVGALGSRFNLVETVVKAAPLVLTGLAVAVAFRARFWNIGAEGQLLAGALCATAVATRLFEGAPALLLLPAVVLAGAFGGALFGALAGLLRAARGVSEVISTILLNFVAISLVALAVHGPLQEAARAYPKSDPFPAAALLPSFGRVHAGLLAAMLLALLLHALLFRTPFGFRLRAVGLAPTAARFAGISPERIAVTTLALSGALAGFAGAVEVAGVTGQLYEGLSAGTGYTAIAVALLARLHPLWVIPSALFFGALEAGAAAMQREAGVPAVVTQVVQGSVILLAAGVSIRRRASARLAAAPRAEAA
jgi:simple sugar transport system permease protein